MLCISCFYQMIGINSCFSSTSSLILICTEKKETSGFFFMFFKTHQPFFPPGFFSAHRDIDMWVILMK